MEESKYTNLSTVTSYSKLEPFSEILQSKFSCYSDTGGGGALFQPPGLQVEEATDSSSNNNNHHHHHNHNHQMAEEGVKHGETLVSHGEDSLGGDNTENFGEIIKKTMVETVSA